MLNVGIFQIDNDGHDDDDNDDDYDDEDYDDDGDENEEEEEQDGEQLTDARDKQRCNFYIYFLSLVTFSFPMFLFLCCTSEFIKV